MDNLDINVDMLNTKTLQKMIFLYNALDNGWNIKKKKEYYIFTKKHEGKKEIFDDNYLSRFMKHNSEFKNIKIQISSENNEI